MKRRLNTIIKKGKLTAIEIFNVEVDNYIEKMTTGEPLLSDADSKKLHNSLKDIPEEITAYNKLLAGKGLLQEYNNFYILGYTSFLEAENRLKTLSLFLNDKKMKDNFIDILTNYYPKIITESELEAEKQRRIEKNLEGNSSLDQILFDRLRFILKYEDHRFKDYSEQENEKLLDIYEYYYNQEKGYDIIGFKKDFPEIFEIALQDIKEKIVNGQIPINENLETYPFAEYSKVLITNKALYQSGLPEHKERIEDIFNEKGYYPDEWIQDIAILHNPFNERHRDINLYKKRMGFTFSEIITKDSQEAVLQKINSYLITAYAVYHSLIIFSNKINKPKLTEFIKKLSGGAEITAHLCEQIFYCEKSNIIKNNWKFVSKGLSITSASSIHNSKIKKAEVYAYNIPLIELSISKMVEIMGVRI